MIKIRHRGRGGKEIKHLEDGKASRQFVGLAPACTVDVICDLHKGAFDDEEEEESAAVAPKASLKSEEDRLRSSCRAAENAVIVPLLKRNKTWKKQLKIERENKNTDTIFSAETTVAATSTRAWRQKQQPHEEGNDSSPRHRFRHSRWVPSQTEKRSHSGRPRADERACMDRRSRERRTSTRRTERALSWLSTFHRPSRQVGVASSTFYITLKCLNRKCTLETTLHYPFCLVWYTLFYFWGDGSSSSLRNLQ